MGFGRGIETDARRGPVIGERPGWARPSLHLGRAHRDLVVAVPPDTAAPIDLRALTTPAVREAHAVKLVTPASPIGIAAQRDLVGDARDLLVSVLRQALPGTATEPGVRIAHGIGPDLGFRTIVTVHVGATEVAQALLLAIRRDDPAWDGDLSTLDGDSYVNLLVEVGPGQLAGVREGVHLILAGGSGYGTYFAVATFLHRHLGVRWLFPGEDGAVIPTYAELVRGVVDEFEEPRLRSRSFGGVTSVGPRTAPKHSMAEIDELRAWQLRNRLRPHDDMTKLFVSQFDMADSCNIRPPIQREFVLATMEVEDRVPVDHVLHNFLSPYRSPLGSTTRRIDGAGVAHYPELRVRDFSGAPGATSHRPDGERLHRELGALSEVVTFREDTDPCATISAACCPTAPKPDGTRTILRVQGGPSPLADNLRAALGANFSHRVEQRVGAVTLRRCIPRAFETRLEGDLLTFPNWHPCIFDHDATLLGSPKRPRTSLVYDLATQLAVSLRGRRLRGRDEAHSIAFDDLETWCQCDACLRADDDGGPSNALMMYQGYVIARPTPPLEREANFTAGMGGMTLTAAEITRRTQWLIDPLGGMLTGNFQWEQSAAANPFRDMSFDALAWRGVLWSKGYPSTRTRRVLTLLNAVGEQVRALVGADAAPVLGCLAYTQAMAPPRMSPTAMPSTRPVGESCDPSLMPYMAGVRDTIEYRPDAPDTAPAGPYDTRVVLPSTESGALGRLLVAPDQFNHERWSRLARQTGFYEYLSGAGYVGPHLYSKRLHTAIRRGLRHHHLRGFICEASPNWCFDAPMLWELSHMLWDPDPQRFDGVASYAASLRVDFCKSAFGEARNVMLAYFDLCEEAWAATRDGWVVYDTAAQNGRPYPDRRLRSTASTGLCGDGFGGRGAQITTLDGFYGAPSGGGARNRLLQCWALLNRAYELTAGDEPSRRRVQLFRRGFGLTLLLGLWYEPVQRAFEMIRQYRPDLARMRAMTNVVGAVVHAQSEVRPSVSGVNLGGTVEVLTGYSDEHPTEARLNIPPRWDGATLSAADSVLRDAAAVRIVPRAGTNGLRSLRNQVHRYLAQFHGDGASAAFPTFMSQAREIGSLRDVGMGLFDSRAGAVPLADDAPFPSAPIEGPHRIMGLDLPSLMEYVNWWNSIPRTGATPLARARAMEERIQLLSNITPDPGFGWCFQGIREAAGMVAVHGYRLNIPDERRRRQELLDSIVRG